MRFGNVMWMATAIVVALTVTSFFARARHPASDVSCQSVASPSQTPEILERYPVANYNEPPPVDDTARLHREKKNSRYDNQEWVQKNPHPETSRIGLYDESHPPKAIPAVESDVILIGQVVGAAAFLSNDKRGVYSEYTVKVSNVLKGNLPVGGEISLDRPGGVVLYPDGRRVLYTVAEKDLPLIGGEYIFFLKDDKKSDNYEVVTFYQIDGNQIIPVDAVDGITEVKGKTVADIIKAVKAQLSATRGDKNEN